MDISGKTLVLAFYLPQYHETEENNNWWGEGFTDWVNVKKAIPLFQDHYQPRQPYKNNYYNLLEDKTLEQQSELAQKYGLGGFCFYHYWLGNDKKLLEKPIEKYRDSNSVNTPYCLCWANHSWSNTWGDKRIWDELLIGQKYEGEEEWIVHFNYLLDFFKDEKYILIDNKPVFVIYRAQDIPRAEKMFAVWNSMAMKNGFAGLYLIQMHTGMGYDKRVGLYSAVADFEPIRTWRDDCFNYSMNNKAQNENLLFKDYDKIYSDIINRKWQDGFKHFYGAFPDWDNTPRKGKFGRLIVGSSPEKFEHNMKILLEKSVKTGRELVFVNAWNEWAEGAYLEPDEKYGYSYLESLRSAVNYAHQFNVEEKIQPLGLPDLVNQGYDNLNQILINWISAEVVGDGIRKFFAESGFKRIAIYGAGSLGMTLYHALKESNVEIKYYVDKKAGSIELGLPIALVKQDDINQQEKVDAIIVTVSRDFYKIYDELKNRQITSEIISLEKIINAL